MTALLETRLGLPLFARGKVRDPYELPAGLRQSEKLPEPIFTPATKAESGHDENVTFDRMSADVGGDLAGKLRDASLRLYAFAAEQAESSGLILADTKFEFGLIDGRV